MALNYIKRVVGYHRAFRFCCYCVEVFHVDGCNASFLRRFALSLLGELLGEPNELFREFLPEPAEPLRELAAVTSDSDRCRIMAMVQSFSVGAPLSRQRIDRLNSAPNNRALVKNNAETSHTRVFFLSYPKQT